MPNPPTPPFTKVPLRVVVLGANGMLGSSLVRRLGADTGIAVRRFERSQINLGDPLLVEQVVAPLSFDWLINAAAFTKVDDCENQSGQAYLINSHAPGQLARLCAAKGARMIHFSTDYVFDGHLDRPYTEQDEPHPISVYGKSKLMGEHEVMAADPAHIVMRLSWLFGSGRPGFPEWVLRQAATGPVGVVEDKRGCPTGAEDVAAAVEFLIADGRFPGGMLHFCNPPACSWYEYACEILRLQASPVRPEPIRWAELPGLTRRPTGQFRPRPGPLRTTERPSVPVMAHRARGASRGKD